MAEFFSTPLGLYTKVPTPNTQAVPNPRPNHPPSLRRDLESYLKTRGPVSFLTDLRSYLQSTDTTGRTFYDIPLMNALILHVGEKAIEHIKKTGNAPSVTTIAQTSHMDIFQNLAVDLDSEGRYLLFSANYTLTLIEYTTSLSSRPLP